MPAEASPPAPPPTAPLRLVFAGECLEGHDPRAVREAVAAALKLDDARAARLFSGRRVVLRSAVDEATALRYVSRFRQLGAVLQVEPAAAAAPARAPTPAPAPSPAPSPAPPPTTAPAPPPARRPVPPPARASNPAPAGGTGLSWELPWRTVALWVGALVVAALTWLLVQSVMHTLLDDRSPASQPAAVPAPGNATAGPTRPPVPAVPTQGPAPAVGASSAGAPDDALPADMGPAARIDYRQHYLPAAGHKAFALGRSGHDWHVGAASEDEAREAALTLCMQQQSGAGTSCRVIDVDGELTE